MGCLRERGCRALLSIRRGHEVIYVHDQKLASDFLLSRDSAKQVEGSTAPAASFGYISTQAHQMQEMAALTFSKHCDSLRDVLFHIRQGRVPLDPKDAKLLSEMHAANCFMKHMTEIKVGQLTERVQKTLEEYSSDKGNASVWKELPVNSCDNLSTADTMNTANTMDTFDGSSSRVSKKLYQKEKMNMPCLVGAWANLVERKVISSGSAGSVREFFIDAPDGAPIACSSRGRWATPRVLVEGSRIRTVCRFDSLDDLPVVLPPGLRGSVCYIDDDGDAEVFFPALPRGQNLVWISSGDLQKLETFTDCND
eukprot:TRINITY_DN20685_c1_g2_i2.p1 TRINITY_DN20685_c1_g2~~TRINITY_DN20685_c1_g2_i2.p1  ORF type:complete len:310 (+),score=49.33 TRINITY_DN20685_c1_g2_i2:75-1004(+)